MASVVPSAVHISPEHSEISEPVAITIRFSSSALLHHAQWKLRYVVSHGCLFRHRAKLFNVIASGMWQVDMANARHVIDVARSEFVDYRYVCRQRGAKTYYEEYLP